MKKKRVGGEEGGETGRFPQNYLGRTADLLESHPVECNLVSWLICSVLCLCKFMAIMNNI